MDVTPLENSKRANADPVLEPETGLGLMNMRAKYFVLCIAGFVLPYSQFVPWLFAHGFDARLFFSELFSNRIGSFFGLDVVVSALVLMPFIRAEGRRLGVKRVWVPIAGTLLVGVSFGFPLFLYMRETRLRQFDSGAAGGL